MVGHRVLGVAAVDLISGEAGLVTQVLAPGQAVAAAPTGVAKPRHTHSVSQAEGIAFRSGPVCRYGAHDLVSYDQRQLGFGQLAVYYVKIGATDGAGGHFDEHLPGTGFRRG